MTTCHKTYWRIWGKSSVVVRRATFKELQLSGTADAVLRRAGVCYSNRSFARWELTNMYMSSLNFRHVTKQEAKLAPTNSTTRIGKTIAKTSHARV